MAEFTSEDRAMVWTAAHRAPAVDVRVFFDPPGRSSAPAPGLDALLTTPEILAEFFRRRAFAARSGLPAGVSESDSCLRSLAPTELADIVWRYLFVDNAPVSEPVRIVLTTMGMFGLDVGSGDLRLLREQYAAVPETDRREKTLELANVDLVLHPVECLDVDAEGKNAGAPVRHRIYRPVLSLSDLFAEWKESAKRLRQRGFGIKARVDEFTVLELRRYLAGVVEQVGPAALSVDWPEGGHTVDDAGLGRLVREAVIPLCRETGLALLLAAGGAGTGELSRLWREAPEVRFLLFPGSEDQFAASAVEAFGGRNVLLCGPDQPLSFPRALGAFVGLRLETLGSAFHACHSGASTPEELVGCWAHMRWTVGTALIRHYEDLWRTGWKFSEADVAKDASAIFGGNARVFLGL